MTLHKTLYSIWEKTDLVKIKLYEFESFFSPKAIAVLTTVKKIRLKRQENKSHFIFFYFLFLRPSVRVASKVDSWQDHWWWMINQELTHGQDQSWIILVIFMPYIRWRDALSSTGCFPLHFCTAAKEVSKSVSFRKFPGNCVFLSRTAHDGFRRKTDVSSVLFIFQNRKSLERKLMRRKSKIIIIKIIIIKFEVNIDSRIVHPKMSFLGNNKNWLSGHVLCKAWNIPRVVFRKTRKFYFFIR